MPYSDDVLLNDFAIRSFRDTADHDYIAARICFRASLFPQYYWSALQAIEKYLKCILVLNRIQATRTHKLRSLLNHFDTFGSFKLNLSRTTHEFINKLDDYGPNRYFVFSWDAGGTGLVEMDYAVWDIRRYARPTIKENVTKDAENSRMKERLLEDANKAADQHPQKFRIRGGAIERILENMKHPARSPLVWQNGCFGNSLRKKVTFWDNFHAANSPLTLRPEMLDKVRQYVYISDEAAEAFRNLPPSTKI